MVIAKAVGSLLIAACVQTAHPSVLLCRDLTGVVYWNHSGPSGHGTGTLQLSTDLGLVEVDYQKPIQHNFSSDRCWELGAIWSVTTKQSSLNEELIRARCAGKLDMSVHSAWMAVRNYIQSVAKAAGAEFGFQPNRRKTVNVTLGELQVNLAGYLDFGSTGMCLEMRRKIDKKTAVIESSADCYFTPNLSFRVEQVQSSMWQVSSVEPAPQQ